MADSLKNENVPLKENNKENIKQEDDFEERNRKAEECYIFDLIDENGHFNFEKYLKLEDADNATKSILTPYKHISSKGGKNFRSSLVLAFHEVHKLNEKKVKCIKFLIELFQSVSLMLDDIEDNSILRRGLPCAHLVYGLPSTLNSATYFLCACLKIMIEIVPAEQVQKVMTIYMDGILKCHEGQAMDIYFRENLIVPTEEEYLKMVDLKTGMFFKLVVCTYDLFMSKDPVYEHELQNNLGRYFQIKDDYINLNCNDYSKMKGFAEDISEGKFSFPIIHAINKFPEDDTIIKILKQRTYDPELKKLVIEKLKKAGSFEYTEKYLENILLKIKARLDQEKEYGEKAKKLFEQIVLDSQKHIINY